MTKTYSEGHVKRGAAMFTEYNRWEGEASHTNRGKAAAPVPIS